MKVLLIDNNQDTISAITEYFDDSRHTSLIASTDIVNGVNKIKNQDFDIIIVNQELFKREGLVDYSEILKKNLNQKLGNTILLSKATNAKEIEPYIRKGFKSFVITPFDINDFHEKVVKIININS